MNSIIRWGIALVLCCVSNFNLFSQVKKLEDMEDYRQFQYYYELANKNNNEQNYAAGLLNVEKVWDFISRLEDMQKAWEEENRAKVGETERKLEDMGREVKNAAKETRLALFMDAVVQAEEEALRAKEEEERERIAQARALERAEEAARRAEEAAKRLDEARLALEAVQKEEAVYLALAENGTREIERKAAIAAEAESKAGEQKRIAQENLAVKQRIETALIRTLASEEAKVDQSKREFEAQSTEANRVIQQARLQAQLLSNQLHARDALERTGFGQTQAQAPVLNRNRTLTGTDSMPAATLRQSQEIAPLSLPQPGTYDAFSPAEDGVQSQAPLSLPQPGTYDALSPAEDGVQSLAPLSIPQPGTYDALSPAEDGVQSLAPVPRSEASNPSEAADRVQDQNQMAEGRIQYQNQTPDPAPQYGVYVPPVAIRRLEGFSGDDTEGRRTRISEPPVQIPPAAPDGPEKAEPQLPAKYVVKRGDTLWKIAALEFIYNDGGKAGFLFTANRDIISDSNLIEPGMILTIPSVAGEERGGTR